ncbi:hypothetical protein SISSUDRAFT_801381 [Sistotremastrum suecicum HHB10207 ss-3]|uniref:Uncharacterized protein n=1 Tax=Sistotremastrum suecicum HHB10207 ss-3 TaxID=1314776 RepID=A0A166HS23_9AGAM|nr:hypothetical protein SISSUDRAFT_801381 [Sistotremastrum suecicum HHB10207 ss-3]
MLPIDSVSEFSAIWERASVILSVPKYLVYDIDPLRFRSIPFPNWAPPKPEPPIFILCNVAPGPHPQPESARKPSNFQRRVPSCRRMRPVMDLKQIPSIRSKKKGRTLSSIYVLSDNPPIRTCSVS